MGLTSSLCVRPAGGRIAAGDGRDGQTVINISGGEAVQEASAPETPEA